MSLMTKCFLVYPKGENSVCHIYRLEISVEVQSEDFNPFAHHRNPKDKTPASIKLQRHLGAPAATTVLKMTHSYL